MIKRILTHSVLLVLLSLTTCIANAQITETFQSWASVGTYSSSSANQSGSGGTWSFVSCIVAPTGAVSGTGSKGYVQFQAANGILTLPAIASGGVGTMSIQARFSSSNGGFSVEKYNGTSWVTVQALTGSSNTASLFTISVNDGSANLKLRINNTGGTGSRALYVHDVSTTTSCSAPVIGTNPSASAQTACSGGSITALSVSATGSSLTYQWYKNSTATNTGGTSLSGATSASYTPSNTLAGTTYYYCIVSSGACNTTSNASGAVTINTAPSITTQPSSGSQNICSGGTITGLSAAASGTGLTYQWYSNTANNNTTGTLISGATSASYTPSNTLIGTTYYYCIVSGTCTPSVTSSVSGGITVNAPISVTGQPSASSQTLCSGGATTALSITASGAGLTYQWYSNATASNTGGSSISGATSATYSPSNTLVGTTYYYCVVSSSTCSSTQTSNASGGVTVNALPAITTQPSTSAQTICSGGTITALSVSATGAGIIYQWYSNTANNNTTGASISGATSSTYTPSNTLSGVTYYYCVVSGTCSPAATSNTTGAITVNTIPATPAGTISAGANPACGSTTLSYSSPSGSIYWETSATGTSTTNPTTSAYTLSSTGTIYARAYNGSCWSSGTANSGSITINVTPTITTNPANRIIAAGSNTTFVSAATNAASYLWQLSTDGGGTWATVSNGGVYSTATTNTLTITGATYTMNGYQYRVKAIGNSPCADAGPSNIATLTVTYCTSQAAGSNTGDGITSVVFNTINNTSTRTLNPGYNDYTGTTTTVVIGSPYTLSSKVNTAGNYTNYAKAWIDWNHDGIFTTGTGGGEEYDLGSATNVTSGITSITPSITIPASALTGNTRMRVITEYGAVPTPCITSFDGETEDYTLVVQAACTSPDAIAFVSQPSNVVQDGVMSTVTVKAYCTSSGNTATSYTGNITLTVSRGGCGYVSQTVAAVNGIATFSNIKFTRSAQTGISLTASATGFSNIVSNTFNVTTPSGTAGTTTIINENFDGSSPAWPYTSTTISTTTASGIPYVGLKDYTTNPYGNSSFKKSLVKSHTTNNSSSQGESTSQIVFNNVPNLSSYNSVQVSFSLGSLPSLNSGAAGNGVDANENMIIETSLDGGTTWNTFLTYFGSSNYLLPLSTSSAATLAYNANASYNADHANTSTQSAFIIILPSGTSQFRLRITATDNREEENWAIDNIQITGTTQSSGTPKPLPTASGSTYSNCANTSTVIAVAIANTQGATSYTWSPTTNISSTTSSGPSVSPSATTNYTVTVTDADGCTASATDIINIPTIPGAVTLASSTITAVEPSCPDASGWTYYTDPTDATKWVFGIYKNGNTFTANVDLTVKTASPVQYDSKINSSTKKATYTMGRYWNVTMATGSINGTTNPVKVRFFYNNADLTQMSTDANSQSTSFGLSSSQVNGIEWFKTNTGLTYDPTNNTYSDVPNKLSPSSFTTSTSTLNGVAYVEYAGLKGFSGGGAALRISPGGYALPVELLYINATPISNNYIRVSWATASEIDNEGFDLERSIDGVNFEKIAFISGHNNSNTENSYGYNDKNISPNAVYYYRLKQIDNDGHSEYTTIVSAMLLGEQGFVMDELKPNPASNQVVVNAVSDDIQSVNVVVTDMLGRTVVSQIWQLNPGLNGTQLDISALVSGTYTVTLKSEHGYFAKKLAVTK